MCRVLASVAANDVRFLTRFGSMPTSTTAVGVNSGLPAESCRSARVGLDAPGDQVLAGAQSGVEVARRPRDAPRVAGLGHCSEPSYVHGADCRRATTTR